MEEAKQEKKETAIAAYNLTLAGVPEPNPRNTYTFFRMKEKKEEERQTSTK